VAFGAGLRARRPGGGCREVIGSAIRCWTVLCVVLVIGITGCGSLRLGRAAACDLPIGITRAVRRDSPSMAVCFGGGGVTDGSTAYFCYIPARCAVCFARRCIVS